MLMPRTGRIVLPNTAHHIVQRGHNRQVVFAEPRDYEYYLGTLVTWKTSYNIKVYAYCLMTNHVHLVLRTPDDTAVLGQLMKRLAGRQTRYINRQAGRRGTLWESRYKSSPIQTDAYLLACCRYVELNPVRACMVAVPEEYRWSSYLVKIGGAICPWLDQDSCYTALGDNPGDRSECYRSFVSDAIPEGEWDLIRKSVQRNQLTGNHHFITEVERLTGRRIEHRGPGNQPRTTKEPKGTGLLRTKGDRFI